MITLNPYQKCKYHPHLQFLKKFDSLQRMLLQRQVLGSGVGLSTYSDSELITQALCMNPPEGEVNGPNWPARIKHFMQLAPLSYALVIMLKDRIYAVRDPYGNRPLCLGRIMSTDGKISLSYSNVWPQFR